INKTRNSGICRTCHPAPGFNSPELRISHVLILAGSISPPAVVGDNSNKLCPLFYGFGNISAPNGFIADNRRSTNPALRIKNRRLLLPAKAACRTTESGKQRFHEGQSR